MTDKFQFPVFIVYIVLKRFQDLTLADKGHSCKYIFGKKGIIFILMQSNQNKELYCIPGLPQKSEN